MIANGQDVVSQLAQKGVHDLPSGRVGSISSLASLARDPLKGRSRDDSGAIVMITGVDEKEVGLAEVGLLAKVAEKG